MRIAVVISTSTTELRFFKAQIEQCKKFAAQIVVTFGTHRYDGVTPEPFVAFEKLAAEYPDVLFVSYLVKPPQEFHNPLKRKPAAFWHNISRITGVEKVQKEMNWILFLDGDEIPDGQLFTEWVKYTFQGAHFETNEMAKIGYAFSNYWYFKEPIYRATVVEQSAMLIPRSLFFCLEENVRILMHDFERYGLIDFIPLQTHTLSLQGDAMIHHYSWVRSSKEDILNKVRNWGHKSDKPWEQLVEEHWDLPFDGTDFVHGYQYTTVENTFGL